MLNVKDYNPSKDPRLIDCKTECGNGKCYARRYGLFAEKACPYFVEPKPKTNADRIRAMTDEELAALIGNNIDCSICKKEVFDTTTCPGSIRIGEKDCYDCWLDWLKKEAEDA